MYSWNLAFLLGFSKMWLEKKGRREKKMEFGCQVFQKSAFSHKCACVLHTNRHRITILVCFIYKITR